eukprot:TRINITY_DN24470_c0_g1_i5.p3 TRINITY_DN24470_c0_g1~~TRINITY_DN24470_c0_g1_i5.p3  ORF type:complete len:111 (-),score=14.95 TRINITY_DN24470_c0_g1_i5:426-758(-)
MSPSTWQNGAGGRERVRRASQLCEALRDGRFTWGEWTAKAAHVAGTRRPKFLADPRLAPGRGRPIDKPVGELEREMLARALRGDGITEHDMREKGLLELMPALPDLSDLF